MTKTEREAVVIEVEDADPRGEAPFDARLRRALKCLLRSFGLRVVSVEPKQAETDREL